MGLEVDTQGLVVCVGGAPISWQSAQRPYVGQSTEESELTSKALNAGRATESLLAAIYQLDPATDAFWRVLYGDNMASISIARGEAAAT